MQHVTRRVGLMAGVLAFGVLVGACGTGGEGADPWPAATRLARCPPQPTERAAGFVDGDAVHPAVVVMARATSPFQLPDRIQWLSAEWPGPLDWPHELDWPNHARQPLEVPSSWLAQDLQSLQQVICLVARTANDAEIEECAYQGQGRILRVRGDLVVTSYDPRTGAILDEQVVVGQDPPPCPESHTFGQSTVDVWRGGPPPLQEVVELVGQLVAPGAD
jgi:hypothetical protein